MASATCHLPPAPLFSLGLDLAMRAYESGRDRDALDRGFRSSSDVVRAAMGYCDRGWEVLVLEPGDKMPTGPSAGVTRASARPRVVLDRLGDVPGANIGIRTGGVSGLIGIDIDGEVGESAWSAIWDGEHEPATLMAFSGREDGGRHLYFGPPTGNRALRSGNNALGPGIDVKLNNAYLVAPPSMHESGRRYRWDDPNAKIIELPVRLSDLLAKNAESGAGPASLTPQDVISRTRAVSGGGADTSWGLAALREIAEELAACPPGGGHRNGRDNQANYAYWRIGQVVGGGSLTSDTALERLGDAMDANGLGRAVAKLHAFEKGYQHPVQPAPRPLQVEQPEEEPEVEAPYTTVPLTASELVSMYYEHHETYSDMPQYRGAPAHHWLAGEAPDYWCDPDGLHQLIGRRELPVCIFNARIVLKHKTEPKYLDFSVPCKQRVCVRCHVSKFLEIARHVSDRYRKWPLQEWYFAAFVDKQSWSAFYKRQWRRRGRVQYVRLPGEDRHVVLGATTKDWEDDWYPLDGQQALFNLWAVFWFFLEPGSDERVTSTDAWRLPGPPRSGDYERIGLTTNIERFHKRVEKHGGTVNASSTGATAILPKSALADAAKVADIESTVSTSPEQTMFLETKPNSES